MSAEVGAAFQCLYDNKLNSWDAMAGYWKEVVKRFSGKGNVIGYELLNEPWAGDVYQDPRRLLPQFTEKNYLAPLYSFLHDTIRTIDNEKIIFFEGKIINYWSSSYKDTERNSVI